MSSLLFSPIPSAMVATESGECKVAVMRRWRRSSSEAFFLSDTSAASWPFVILAGEVRRYLNLHRRPFLRSAVAFIAGFEASGIVPASKFDGDIAGFLLIGGEREGLDCFCIVFSEVFSANTRGLCIIFHFMGSFVIICTPTDWNE
jgi:hypothetical protein